MAQNIAFFLFSRKLLRDSEKAAGKDPAFEDIALGEEATHHPPGEKDGADKKNGGPKFFVRKGSVKKGREAGSSKRWEFVFWVLLLLVFLALTVWHWIAILINYADARNVVTNRVEWKHPETLPFPDSTLCFPLNLDYIPFTVYAIEPYVPRLFNWTEIKMTLDVILPRIQPEDFWTQSWNSTSNGRAFLLSSAALLSRLTAIEESGSEVGVDVEAEEGLEWEEPKIEITSDVLIKTHLKVASVDQLWTFLTRTGESKDLGRLRKKVGLELCRVLRVHTKFVEELEYYYRDVETLGCEGVELSWISRRATCLLLPLHRFKASSPRFQIELNFDLSYLYGEFLSFIDFYERNFTLGSSGRAWYAQGTTLSVDGPRRQLHYYGAGVVTAMPGLFSKYLLEIGADFHGEAEGCGRVSVGECADRCHARRLLRACANRCVPGLWAHLLRRPQRHCNLQDYDACLGSMTSDAGEGDRCATDCPQPCDFRSHRLTLVNQGPLGDGAAGSQIRLTYGSLRYQSVSEMRSGLGPHELIALLGGVSNFWLGLSVAGLVHLAWFLLYELPRVRRLEKKQNQAGQTDA